MAQEIVAYCPQCLLLVFAAMGFYQYVLRDRVLNGGASDIDDDLLNMDVEDMDEPTRVMLLELLTNDHLRDQDLPQRESA